MLGKAALFGGVLFLYGIISPAYAIEPTPGVGQNGAPTLYGCTSDPKTFQPTEFPAQITSGWVETNELWNPSCSKPGTSPFPNWREMTYFLDMPLNSTLIICWNGWSWPSDWDLEDGRFDNTKCGYHPGGIPPEGEPTTLIIKRVRKSS